MTRNSIRIASLTVAIGGFLLVGCGGDDGDSGGGTNGGVEVRAEYVEYCDLLRNMDSDTPRVESAEAQLEVAPDELRQDIENMRDLLAIQDQDDPDPDELAAAAEDGVPSLARVLATVSDECGINPLA